MPILESFEAVLVHSNSVNNNYQKTSKVLFTFLPNGQLINRLRHSLTMLNITNTEFWFIEVQFIEQNSKQLEVEYNVNMTLMIG